MSVARCCVVPLPGRQVAFAVEGRELTRWHFAGDVPRPYFYPIVGPFGGSLTRMGHPGAPNHDHHRSVWFAHQQVTGVDFWSDDGPARIRQKQWLAYVDGDGEAAMAVELGWYDGHDPGELLTQEVVAAVRPLADGEWILELQSKFTPTAQSLEFGKTNFGFLAVRVAANLSEHFGGGRLTNSVGLQGERSIFGKPSGWMDYSGPVALRVPESDARDVTAGITYFDHPENVNAPACWHVREDGWMGAAPGMNGPLLIERERPLVLRYQLLIHRGPADTARLEAEAARFAHSPAFAVRKSRARHQAFELSRESTPSL